MVSFRLALLACDDPIPPVKQQYGDYGEIFHRFLAASCTTAFTLDTYDVVNKMSYPSDDIQYDGLLISGSSASAYMDLEWINTLVAYVKRILSDKPALKVFGICFGHQIIARALGGQCVPNNTWEVAVTSIRLTPIGKAIFGPDDLDIQQMHRDHVPMCPPGAHLLGATDVSPNHGMVLFDPASDASGTDLTAIRVLTIQGHPEFLPSIVSLVIDARRALMGERVVQDGLLRAEGIPGKQYPEGRACDGVGRVGKVIWGILGVV